MKIERQGETVRVELTAAELRLLRRALERASFIDTPLAEQAEIQAFCARALDALPLPPLTGQRGRVPEVAILVGLPGAGKSSFYRSRLASTHAHVSKDLMPNVRNRGARQLALLEEALSAGRSVAVDNTNPARADRAPLIAAARARGARVVAYVLAGDVGSSLQRNRARQGRERVPDVAVFVAARRLEPPTREEGFDAVFRVRAEGGEFTVEEVGE